MTNPRLISTSLVTALLVTSILTACTQPNGAPNSGVMHGGGFNKADIGTAAGAIGGGVIGSNIGGGKGNIAAIIGGTLLGGVLGNSVGRSLDNADMAAYDTATQRAMETGRSGQTLPWRNTRSGNYGSITPSDYYQTSSGQYCREYSQRITVGGKTQTGYGTACRQPDGTWEIVE